MIYTRVTLVCDDCRSEVNTKAYKNTWNEHVEVPEGWRYNITTRWAGCPVCVARNNKVR